MKTLNIGGLGLSLIMAAVLTGCGGGEESRTLNEPETTPAPAVSATPSEAEESVAASGAFAYQPIGSDADEPPVTNQSLSNVTFTLNSVHFQTIPAATAKTVASKRTAAIEEANDFSVFEGTLRAVEIHSDTVTSFDWLANIDENGMVALSNKTLLLTPGEYRLELLLEKSGRQYVGTGAVIVADTDQLEVHLELNAVIGDVITDVAAVGALSSFEINFPTGELATFTNPRIGVIVNAGDETIYTVNKDSGNPEGVINVEKGDEVFMKFYDGGLQKGKSDTVTAQGGETMELTFKPIYGEVDIQSLGDVNATIDMGFKVPDEIVEEAGGIDNVSAVLSYLNGVTYNEVALELSATGAEWEANYSIPNASYDTLAYSVIFSKTNEAEEIGRCTQESFDLTKDEATKTCRIDLKRGIVMDASFEGVAGFNVYDETGVALAGMAIYADDAFIGFTGSGAFGSKGYLKSYFKPADYVIKAQSETRSYAKEVTIAPLSVNNYEFLIPTGIPEGNASIQNADFNLVSGSSETTDLTVANVGKGILFYEVTVETADGTSARVLQRRLASTNDVLIIGKSADNRNGLMTFDYISANGSVETKTFDYDDTDNRVIVKYKAGSKSVQSTLGGAVSPFQVRHLDVNTAGEYLNGVNTLLNDPDVEYVEPDQKLSIFAAVTDTFYSLQWGHHNDGTQVGYADVDVDWQEYHDTDAQTNSVVVGVIDSGVDYTHPDLAANMWRNPGEIPNNGIDDDGNGYIDDLYGYDFYANDNNPMDENGHGTHVSGIIAAPENGIGVVGINPTAKIMALRFLGPDGSGYTSGAVLALQYAINNGAQVTNNSWGGGGYSQALRDMIAQASAANQLFVAAAGNSNVNIDTTPTYPASYDLENILVVGSSDAKDAKSSFSNYGTATVDILAPGSDIASLFPDNQYVYASGTSMAAPYVTGAVSLLLAKNGTTPYEFVKEAVLTSGDQTAAGISYTASGKRLNAFNAAQAFNPSQEWIILSGELSGELQEAQSKTLGVTVDASYLVGGSNKSANLLVNFTGNTATIPVTLNVQ
jgi:subtilisin family serine protease